LLVYFHFFNEQREIFFDVSISTPFFQVQILNSTYKDKSKFGLYFKKSIPLMTVLFLGVTPFVEKSLLQKP
jgi:hypothetical protein